jgi:hypothetical protein
MPNRPSNETSARWIVAQKQKIHLDQHFKEDTGLTALDFGPRSQADYHFTR